MDEATCAECGTEPVPPRRKRYCSERCRKAAERKRYRAKRVPMRCDHCGETFMGRRWFGDAEHKRRYCSTECERQAKRERYGKRCERHGWIGRVSCPDCCAEAEVKRAAREARRREEAARPAWLRGDPCAYCGSRGDGDEFSTIGIDHITPRSAGGEDEWDNWTACCRRCNGQKGTLPLLGFLLWRQIAPAKADLDARMQRIHSLRTYRGVAGTREPVS